MIRLIAMMFFALAACSVLDAPVAQLERWQKQRAAGAMAASWLARQAGLDAKPHTPKHTTASPNGPPTPKPPPRAMGW